LIVFKLRPLDEWDAIPRCKRKQYIGCTFDWILRDWLINIKINTKKIENSFPTKICGKKLFIITWIRVFHLKQQEFLPVYLFIKILESQKSH
jgi:hypothetical protein